MSVQKLLRIALGLSIFTTSCTYAMPSDTYKAAIIADCSNAHSCSIIDGDILWNDKDARSVLPLKNGMLFLGTNTHLKVLDLERNIQEFSLLSGTLGLRVWKTSLRQSFKIRTGNLMISMREAGFYQIEVSPNGRTTTLRVISGTAEIRLGKLVKAIKTGQSFLFNDNKYPKYSTIRMPAYDDHYYFALNFIRSYYRMYPVDAPSADLISQSMNGPSVEIIYYPPITVYAPPGRIYHRPVVVREQRVKGTRPAINVDINLEKTFGERKKPESPKQEVREGRSNSRQESDAGHPF